MFLLVLVVAVAVGPHNNNADAADIVDALLTFEKVSFHLGRNLRGGEGGLDIRLVSQEDTGWVRDVRLTRDDSIFSDDYRLLVDTPLVTTDSVKGVLVCRGVVVVIQIHPLHSLSQPPFRT